MPKHYCHNSDNHGSLVQIVIRRHKQTNASNILSFKSQKTNICLSVDELCGLTSQLTAISKEFEKNTHQAVLNRNMFLEVWTAKLTR